MFCPRCGAENRQAEGYCTRCGDYLPELDASGRLIRRRRAGTPEERLRKMAIFSAINAALALFSSLALYAAHLGRAGDAHWTVFAAAACCLVIAGHQTVSLVLNLQLQHRLKKARASDAAAHNAVAEAKAFAEGNGPRALGAADESGFADVRSVTEHTTELLEPLPRRGGGQGQGG